MYLKSYLIHLNIAVSINCLLTFHDKINYDSELNGFYFTLDLGKTKRAARILNFLKGRVMLRNGCNQSVIHLPLYFNLLNGGQIYQVYWVIYSQFITTMKQARGLGAAKRGGWGNMKKC